MNYSAYMTIVGWESRNWRHRDKAIMWCKDYGLEAMTRYVLIGELYAKERKEMEAKFRSLFTGKTERFFFITMCKSCLDGGISDVRIKEKISRSGCFELIQMPEKPYK